MKQSDFLIGVDTGGTFTDLLLIKKNVWQSIKVPSTPHNPSKAIINGLSQLNLNLNLNLSNKKLKTITKENSFNLIHGSTVGTNAFLEKKGAKLALITTKGFTDILEIGRQNRRELYNINEEKPTSLVPAKFRYGIKERLDHQGKTITSIDLEELNQLKDKIKKHKLDGIAVCLLFSYVNKKHEKKIKEIFSDLSIPLFLSSEILPEFREFERTSATVINAYISPKMKGYLQSLEKNAGAHKILIMQSNGGVISTKKASEESIHTLLSGPAGGVSGASYYGKKAQYNKIITFDMGGTSTDVSLIDKKIKITTSFELEGMPLPIPMIPIHTVGAGGGSIAWVDEGGLLRVGPQSAGADPGPACYGKGEEITITDAHLFLGRLPARFISWKNDLK